MDVFAPKGYQEIYMAQASYAKKQQRNILDKTLLHQVGGRPTITQNDLEEIWGKIAPVLTLRRLAHFLNQKKRKLCETAVMWLKKRVRFSLHTLPIAPTKFA
jgi:hypothetical protein